MQTKIIRYGKRHSRAAASLVLGVFAIGLLTGSAWQDEKSQQETEIQDFQNGNNESKAGNIQDFHSGNPDGKEIVSVDLSVNPFVETASETGTKANTGGNKGGNFRNLPAIPAVYPTSQPRPVLPLPSIPRSAPQQQAVVASAPAPASAGQVAPKENKEARIAFLGGEEIMFAQGNGN
ncbi:hypothetical protein [Selenomonas ruminis]|uniref:Uncharacterized protein n=1 Tax=Selenomonas ruminis TaxID=2593411 RepID=A0A5D6VXJ0_9FIRM|nr:hypothetical protein [Selenomonas sp. mPRGC5]TYZ20197.1 hypothetical protein FZ040_12170 [Selenomonas sp. mPRGC5]